MSRLKGRQPRRLTMSPVMKGLILAFGSSSLLAVTYAQQSTQAAPAEQQAQKQERIEVTGSSIRRTDAETASPVQVITREEISRSGKQTIAEVIQTVSANNQGSIPGAFTAGFASGSAAVSLRGLGVNATLVLVNGRRMAPYGLADDGQRTFVDLNAIPLEAIERVEVLKDGASAIYGSDAIAGVVNIILRKDYQGVTAAATLGTSQEGDGNLVRASVSAGFGNLAQEKYNFSFTMEAAKEERIVHSDRDGYLGTNDLRAFGWYDNRRGAFGAGFGAFPDGTPAFNAATPYGTVRSGTPNVTTGPGVGSPFYDRVNLSACPEINPLTNVCLFDPINYEEIQPETERFNITGRGSFQLTPDWLAYTELGFFTTKVSSQTFPSGVRNVGGVFDPRNPSAPVPQITVLPAGHPDNPLGINRGLFYQTADVGPRRNETDTEVQRWVAGLQGSLQEWNLDAGIGYLESKTKTTRKGFIRFSALQAALDNGTYRINNPGLVSREVYDVISPALVNTSKSSITFIDAKASRDLIQLPGGALALALGTEYREEKADTPPTPFTEVADIIGLGFSAFKAKRDVTAVFAELSAPVHKTLELNAAVRVDNYSDVGTATTPKLGVKFSPVRQLSIRGTYAEAFRAPGPAEAGESASAGFTNILNISVGNPNIKPEKAKSTTLGIIFEPMPGTSATLDVYQIKRRNEILGADQALVLVPNTGGLANGSLPGAVPGSFGFYDENGDLTAILSPYTNATFTKTKGIDLDLRQRFNLGDYGRLTAGLTLTHIQSFKRSLTDGRVLEYAGTHGPFVLSAAGGTPKNKAVLSFAYDRGPWAGTVNFNYVSGMKAIDHEGETLVDNEDGTYSTTTAEGAFFNVDPNGLACGVFHPDGRPLNGDCRIPSFTTADVSVKYSGIKNLELSFSVLNLFDRKAPFDPYTYGGVNYNPVFHQAGAVGRFFNIGARYKFY